MDLQTSGTFVIMVIPDTLSDRMFDKNGDNHFSKEAKFMIV